MPTNCKECKTNYQVYKGRVNYSQLSPEQRELYWHNFKLLGQVDPIHPELPVKIDQGEEIIK